MINLKTLLGLPSYLESTDNLLSLELYLSVDNRKLNFDGIFVAIVGERYNSLEHLDKVFESGCRFVVYEKNEENDKLIKPWVKKLVFIAVNDILMFVQEAGFAVANIFKARGGKIIGISGSNGKTTTKEMLSHILKQATRDEDIISTQENNNNHLGVPFTLFQIRKETSIAIIELGSNHPGEIEHLCKMIRPQFGLTTNIGDTHLEFFGSRENVFKEEAKLYDYVTEKFFINNDDELLRTLPTSHLSVRYGKNATLDLDLANKKLNEYSVENSFLVGKHNFLNLMLSVAVAGEVLKRELIELLSYAKSFAPTDNRSQWVSLNEQEIFLDAYNANPSSMKISLDGFLEHLDSIGAKAEDSCLILGDMNELGANGEKFHQDFGRQMQQLDAGEVIFIGKFAKAYAKGLDRSCKTYESSASCKQKIRSDMSKFKYVFIKGSRSLQLETILDIR